MVNFVRLAATAQRLIDENGRAISIVQLERDPTDVNKPWRGDPAPRDTGQPEATVSTIGVFVDPGSLVRWGFSTADSELVKRSDQVVLVSGNGVNQALIEDYDEVVDTDATRWKINSVVKLRPATLTMLYALGVSR